MRRARCFGVEGCVGPGPCEPVRGSHVDLPPTSLVHSLRPHDSLGMGNETRPTPTPRGSHGQCTLPTESRPRQRWLSLALSPSSRVASHRRVSRALLRRVLRALLFRPMGSIRGNT